MRGANSPFSSLGGPNPKLGGRFMCGFSPAEAKAISRPREAVAEAEIDGLAGEPITRIRTIHAQASHFG